MDIKVNNKQNVFLFDLDDTLYKEIDFLKSGFRYISEYLKNILGIDVYTEMIFKYHNGENVFDHLLSTYRLESRYNISKQILLSSYRDHYPIIDLIDGVYPFLERISSLQFPIALITDGRSVTQRNKLKALKIDFFFTDILISEEFGSEKPNLNNFLYFEKKYANSEFYFFGDNTSKDFMTPINLKWNTYCLKDSGINIHKQEFRTSALSKLIIFEYYKNIKIIQNV